MKVLELFSGTGSIGKVCKELGYEVVSLDLKNADINTDVIKWDYKKQYKEGDFDIIWASPPCDTFSILRRCWVGRKLKAHGEEIITKEILDRDMMEIGVPILRKTQEIIDYFKPSLSLFKQLIDDNQKTETSQFKRRLKKVAEKLRLTK